MLTAFIVITGFLAALVVPTLVLGIILYPIYRRNGGRKNFFQFVNRF